MARPRVRPGAHAPKVQPFSARAVYTINPQADDVGVYGAHPLTGVIVPISIPPHLRLVHGPSGRVLPVLFLNARRRLSFTTGGHQPNTRRCDQSVHDNV